MSTSYQKSVYLAGTMSNLKGFGIGWRKKIKKWLTKRDILVFDPCDEEANEHIGFKITKKNRAKWETFPQQLQEQIMLKDLEEIELGTRFIICFFTKYSTGTVSELAHAFYYRIPVYMVTNRKLLGWPGTVAHAAGNKVFKSFKALKRWLVKEDIC